MKIQMNVAEAKGKLSELIARAEAGDEVVIARDGVPAVVLKPANDLAAPAPRRLGALAHLGPIWEAPDAWAPDDEAADFLGQTFEEDGCVDVEKGSAGSSGS
ncbi:MAG: type II toxin-antitoxin system prevent-host-death family antitoxin [Pseudomonadota bacterium]